MITAAEIARGVQGAWRLARLDPGGMDEFDKTVEGFWRSFWAAGVLAPVYLFMMSMDFTTIDDQSSPVRFVAIETIALVIAWVAFPLLMFHVTKLIDREANYIGYVVAYNWSHLIQMLIILPVQVLSPIGPSGEIAGGAAFLLLVATIMILFYVGYIAKTALKISGPMAAGIVAIDYGLTLFINAIKLSMLT